MSSELFVEVTRNGTVESRHTGTAVICDSDGAILECWGNIDEPVFPRSALKPIQAISLVESGACDHYALSDAEISLSCASHLGQAMHVTQVTSWLDRLGLDEHSLACGAEMPSDEASARRLLTRGEECCRIHHNCSGKHTGFLATALHLGEPVDGYHKSDHRVQQLALDVISDLAGTEIRNHPVGIDGCGFPAVTMPLRHLGIAMARFADPAKLPPSRTRAIARIRDAISNEPLYLSGHGSMVSELIEATGGAVLVKTGAEGVIVASLPDRGLGIALKISDGSVRARSVALLAILNHLGALSDAEKNKLAHHINPEVLNSRKQIVGEIRPALSWLQEKNFETVP